ncbi:MAG: TetR/AcrR family transcriptional regulator [Pseudoxanthomonas sp.]
MVSNLSPASHPKPAAAKLSGPGRPKDLGKRAAILEAAKRLFPIEGFAGVSMDQIAAEAGVSKLTVYSHFGDKEALFFAAVEAKCDEMLPHDLFSQELQGPLRAQLEAIAAAYVGLVCSAEAISTHRMMISPGGADDSLRKLFWEAGPQRTHDVFGSFLVLRVEAGELEIPDVQCAAEQFFSLLRGEMHSRMLCGLCANPARAAVSNHIQASVDMFLRAYGKR